MFKVPSYNDVVLVIEPIAGIHKRFVEVLHHEVYHSAMGVADEALVAVLATMKGQGWMLVSMERAEGLVTCNAQAQRLSDLLDWQGLQLLYI